MIHLFILILYSLILWSHEVAMSIIVHCSPLSSRIRNLILMINGLLVVAGFAPQGSNVTKLVSGLCWEFTETVVKGDEFAADEEQRCMFESDGSSVKCSRKCSPSMRAAGCTEAAAPRTYLFIENICLWAPCFTQNGLRVIYRWICGYHTCGIPSRMLRSILLFFSGGGTSGIVKKSFSIYTLWR